MNAVNMIVTDQYDFDNITLKYNEKIVEVNEVVHTASRIYHRLLAMNIPIYSAVFKLNAEMTKGESLFFDDTHLIHKYMRIETYENEKALDRAMEYFKL